MKQWTLALLVAGVSVFGLARGANYSTGCCQPCDPCCDARCNPCWDPCCDPCWNGGFEAIGEFLYIRPHLCDLNYVIVDNTQLTASTVGAALPVGKQYGVCPDYTPAFRVGVGYVYNDGCNDLTVTYAALWQSETKSVAATDQGGIWMTFGHPRYLNARLNNASFSGSTAAIDARAESKLKVNYNAIDAVAASRRMDGCNLWIRRFVGLRWADIKVREAVEYRGTTLGTLTDSQFATAQHEVLDRAHVWGIGPRFGADLRWDLICGFGIGAHAGASILVGESGEHIAQHSVVAPVGSGVAVDQGLNVLDHTHCHLFPELDARLGVNYLWCCGSCFSLFVEVGYEFESYINAISRTRFNDQAGTSHTACESFNLDGIYLHVKIAI